MPPPHRAEVEEEITADGGLEPLGAAAGRALQHEGEAAALQRALQRQLQHLPRRQLPCW